MRWYVRNGRDGDVLIFSEKRGQLTSFLLDKLPCFFIEDEYPLMLIIVFMFYNEYFSIYEEIHRIHFLHIRLEKWYIFLRKIARLPLYWSITLYCSHIHVKSFWSTDCRFTAFRGDHILDSVFFEWENLISWLWSFCLDTLFYFWWRSWHRRKIIFPTLRENRILSTQ